jgi:hypothetical protein
LGFLFTVEANDCTVNVWSLSTVARHHRMTAAMALKKEQLGTTVFVVTVDLSRPWRVMRCLERWCAELDEAVAATNFPPTEALQLQRRQREYVQARYANGVDGALPDLPEGLLDDAETPHGVPLVVVGTHSEQLFELRPGSAGGPAAAAAQANAVQYHLRRFCLKRGATLVFVPTDSAAAAEDFTANGALGAVGSPLSTASGSTLTNSSGKSEEGKPHVPSALLLQQYLLHRLYPSAFAYDASAFDFDPERPDDELFLCAGQDSPSLASQLELGPLEGMSFEEALPAPPGWAGPSEEEGGSVSTSLAQSVPTTTAGGGGDSSSNGEGKPSMDFDDSVWLASLHASLDTAQAQRAVLAKTTTGKTTAASAPAKPAAAKATAAPPGGAPPLPPPPRSTRASAKSSDAAGAKDFFSSLLNS